MIATENERFLLNHFMPLVSFNASWKHQKTLENLWFSAFLGVIKKEQWRDMC